jgi:hypothetical protein
MMIEPKEPFGDYGHHGICPKNQRGGHDDSLRPESLAGKGAANDLDRKIGNDYLSSRAVP